MTTAIQLLEKLERINVTEAAQQAIEEKAVYGEDAQRQQLFQGLDRDENKIANTVTGSTEYAPLTVEIKTAKGQPTDRITLKDTSDYYTGMKLDVKGDIFTIHSVDEKAEMLDVLYTPLGLGTQAKVKWLVQLGPEFIRRIKRYLTV